MKQQTFKIGELVMYPAGTKLAGEFPGEEITIERDTYGAVDKHGNIRTKRGMHILSGRRVTKEYDFENIADFVYRYIDEFVKSGKECVVKKRLMREIDYNQFIVRSVNEMSEAIYYMISPYMKYANAKKTEDEVTEALEDALSMFF